MWHDAQPRGEYTGTQKILVTSAGVGMCVCVRICQRGCHVDVAADTYQGRDGASGTLNSEVVMHSDSDNG